MSALLIVVACVAAIILLSLWVRHRKRTVDNYFEREYRDPPAGIPPTW